MEGDIKKLKGSFYREIGILSDDMMIKKSRPLHNPELKKRFSKNNWRKSISLCSIFSNIVFLQTKNH